MVESLRTAPTDFFFLKFGAGPSLMLAFAFCRWTLLNLIFSTRYPSSLDICYKTSYLLK
jgi:hypothetical protein